MSNLDSLSCSRSSRLKHCQATEAQRECQLIAFDQMRRTYNFNLQEGAAHRKHHILYVWYPMSTGSQVAFNGSLLSLVLMFFWGFFSMMTGGCDAFRKCTAHAWLNSINAKEQAVGSPYYSLWSGRQSLSTIIICLTY